MNLPSSTPLAIPSSEAVSVESRQLTFPAYPCLFADIRQLRHDVNSLLRTTGLDHPLFHNHDAIKGGNRYDYPLIQYRSVLHRGRSVGGLWALGEEGLGALEQLEDAIFSPKRNGHEHLVHYSTASRSTQVELASGPQSYCVRSFALNHQQAQYWAAHPSRRDQDALLQKALRFAIFGFLNAVGYYVPRRQLTIRIQDIPQGTWYQSPPLKAKKGEKLKGDVLVMDIEFEANIYVPDQAGLGTHKAFGWGVIGRL